MKKMCLGLFVALSAIQPMAASAATITAISTHVEAGSFTLVGGISTEDVDGGSGTGGVRTQVSVNGAEALAEAQFTLSDATAGHFAFATGGELLPFVGSDSQTRAYGVARYDFILDAAADLALSKTGFLDVVAVIGGEAQTIASPPMLLITLNDSPLDLFPTNQGSFNLLPGVAYSLKAESELVVRLDGRAEAVRAIQVGILEFRITSTEVPVPEPVPEPSTWTMIIAGICALRAARLRGRARARVG